VTTVTDASRVGNYLSSVADIPPTTTGKKPRSLYRGSSWLLKVEKVPDRPACHALTASHGVQSLCRLGSG